MIHKITNSLRLFLRRIRPNIKVGRSAIKVYRRFSSLSLPLRTAKKHGVIQQKLRNALLYAAADNTSIYQVSRDIADIDGDTVMYHLAKLHVEDVQQMNAHLLRLFSELRNRGKMPRRLTLAVDSTDYQFYGKQRSDYVIRRESKYVFRFIMVSVVAHKVMFPLAILPVSQLSDIAQLVESLIVIVKQQGVRIRVIYFDRGFYSLAVVRILKRHNIPFVIGAPKSRGVKRVLTHLPTDTARTHEFEYTMRSNGGTESVMLYARWNRRRQEWFTAIGWRVNVVDVRCYIHRWGIETEFRMIKEPRIRTTTVKIAVRYLFVMVSAIICGLYATLRLGEVPTWLDVQVVIEGREEVTLYRVRRGIKKLLEGGKDVVL